MKNKLSIKVVIVILSCSLIGATIGYSISNSYISYKNSSTHLEKIYMSNPTTSNLIKLCDSYIASCDMKYLIYADKLLDSDDFCQAISDVYKYDADFTYNSYAIKQSYFVFTMYICAVNNDIDEFISTMEKYYPQMTPSDGPKYFYSVMSQLTSSFIEDNKEVIVDKMYSIISKTDIPIYRFVTSLNVLSYYQVVDKDNPQVKVLENEIWEICKSWPATNEASFKKLQEEKQREYMNYWTDLLK